MALAKMLKKLEESDSEEESKASKLEDIIGKSQDHPLMKMRKNKDSKDCDNTGHKRKKALMMIIVGRNKNEDKEEE